MSIPVDGSTTTFFNPRKAQSCPAGGSPTAITCCTIRGRGSQSLRFIHPSACLTVSRVNLNGISTLSRVRQYMHTAGLRQITQRPLRYFGSSSSGPCMQAHVQMSARRVQLHSLFTHHRYRLVSGCIRSALLQLDTPDPRPRCPAGAWRNSLETCSSSGVRSRHAPPFLHRYAGTVFEVAKSMMAVMEYICQSSYSEQEK
jgi:hypothetical protein